MVNSLSVVVIGAGGHALVVAEILQLTGYRVVGFIDEVAPQRLGQPFCSGHILGGLDALLELASSGTKHAIVAIGNNEARTRIARNLIENGFRLVNAIHPSASISSQVELGVGSVVAAQAAINPGTRIGDNVIINTSATVDHECQIENGAHVGPGVHIAGRVKVGQRAWLGIGASVIDRIIIGEAAHIGAGSVVVRNIPDGTLAYGNPAQIIKRICNDK